jgi:hypothetical protein
LGPLTLGKLLTGVAFFSDRSRMNFISGYGGGDDDDDGDDNGENEGMSSGVEVLCEMCKSVPRIYKCPRCSVVTCSLECCKQHKSRYERELILRMLICLIYGLFM